jgi:hypothetical protein
VLTAIHTWLFTAFSEVPEESFDAQMLLDPFEKEPDRPPALVQRADAQRWNAETQNSNRSNVSDTPAARSVLETGFSSGKKQFIWRQT